MEIQTLLFPKFLAEELTLLTLIKSDDKYPEVIKEFRRRAGIPENAIDYKDKKSLLSSLSKLNNRSLMLSALSVITYYGLPVRWLTTFLFILLINEPHPPSLDLPIKTIDVQFIEPPVKSPYKYGEVSIHVREGMSKSRLISFLEKDKMLNDMLRKLPRNLDVSKIETKHALAAIKMHKDGKTYADIARIWDAQGARKYDYKDVNKIVTNFRTYVSKHTKRNMKARIIFAIEK